MHLPCVYVRTYNTQELFFVCVTIMYFFLYCVFVQGRSQGGVLWALKNPPPQSEKGPPKGPLECTKRSTRLHKKVHLNVQKGPLLESA